jgi:hypothetical protein
MNRFIKTGSLFVLCTAASVAFASPNEDAYHSGEFFDAVNGYMNWEQTGNTTTENMSERYDNPAYLSRADLSPGSDNFFEAINQYMNVEESEFAAAEPVTDNQNSTAFSHRAYPSLETDNFSDSILNYLDELRI